MPGELCLQNRQRRRTVNLLLLKRIGHFLLEEQFQAVNYELGINLVEALEMSRVNEQFLAHTGSTDVITFDYGDGTGLHGEIFICLHDAVQQAAEFQTTWQMELTRYLIHGLLHLRGYDDLAPALRKTMKQEEERLLKVTAERFQVSKLHKRRATRR